MILRGLAIVFIMLHNFLHLGELGFSGENEMSFSLEREFAFYTSITNGSNVFCEFFSHLGWIGVPVFIFLTGYGVALAAPSQNKGYYIKRNYLKLLALLLPAILFFSTPDVLKGYWPGLLKRASYLTMLANFVYPFVSCNPGVYWYFSLTFQFYLLWAFFERFFNGKFLLGISIISLIGLFVLCVWGPPEALSIYRHCFTGWFPVFALGVWLGKGVINQSFSMPKISCWSVFFLSIILLEMIVLMSRWLVSWIFVPIVALAWFILLGILLMHTHYLAEGFRWIGRLSACIFVCHPIARLLVFLAVFPYYSNLMANVSVYIALTIVISLIYKKVYQWLFQKFLLFI